MMLVTVALRGLCVIGSTSRKYIYYELECNKKPVHLNINIILIHDYTGHDDSLTINH